MDAVLAYFIGFGWLPFLLIVIGIALVIIEMFLPGFGAPGIVGGICLIAGIIIKAESAVEGLMITLVILALLGVVFIFVMRSATHGALSRSPLILTTAATKNEGFSAAEDMQVFLGREGQTLTVLRPAGTAEFDGVRVDVVSESQFIPEGVKVRVIQVEGRRIVVKAVSRVNGAAEGAV